MSSGAMGLLGLVGKGLTPATPPDVQEEGEAQTIEAMIAAGFSPEEAYSNLPMMTETAIQERRGSTAGLSQSDPRVPIENLLAKKKELEQARAKEQAKLIGAAPSSKLDPVEYFRQADARKDREALAKEAQFPWIDGELKKLTNEIQAREYEGTFAAERRKVLEGEIDMIRAAKPIAPIVGGSRAFPGTVLAPSQHPPATLEERPWEAMIDPRTQKMHPSVYRAMLGTMADGPGTMQYGPSQFQREGRHYEETPEALAQHRELIEEREGIVREPQKQRTEALAAPIPAWGGSAFRDQPEVELPGEFATAEEVLGVKRLGIQLPELPLVAAGGAVALADYFGDAGESGFAADLGRSGKAYWKWTLGALRRLWYLPSDVQNILEGMHHDATQGFEPSIRDMKALGTKIAKAWTDSEKRLEDMPERSYVQEAWDLSQGLLLGMTDMAYRMADGITSDADMSQLMDGFLDGAVHFTTPLAHSMYETVTLGKVWDKAPLEAAINVAIIKAPLVKSARGKALKINKAVSEQKLQIAREAEALVDALNPDPMGQTAAGAYPEAWARDKAARMAPKVKVIKDQAAAKMKALDDANTAGYRLDLVADFLDGAAIAAGDLLISPLATVKNLYRRLYQHQKGQAAMRWWLAPRDVRLPLSYQKMIREQMGVHNQRIIDIQDLVRAIPKKHRPLIEEFMWMEHEPLFSVKAADNLVEWHGDKWRLNENGRSKAGIGLDDTALTQEHKAFRTMAAGKIELANRYGRNLVRQVHELTEFAIREGMFADPMALREIYWPNLYNPEGFIKRSMDSWRNRKGTEPRLGPAAHGGEFLTNKLRALGVPIEARAVPVGAKIPDNIINIAENKWVQLPEHLEGYSMRVERFSDPKTGNFTEKHYFNPQEFLKRRNAKEQGGFGMSKGLLDDAMEGLGRLSFDVENFKMYREMLKNKDLVSMKAREGYIYVEAAELRPGIADQWAGILKASKPEALIARAKQAGVDGNLIAEFAQATRNKKGTTRLRNKIIKEIVKEHPQRYGRLSGKWVQEDIWHEMVNVQKYAEESTKWYRKLLRTWKGFKTAWSVTTTARNLLSNVMLFAPMAGISVLNPLNWEFYRQSIIDTLGSSKSGKSIHYKEAFVDGAFQGTFQRVELSGQVSGAFTRRLRAAKNGHEFTNAMFTIAAEMSGGVGKAIQLPGVFYGLIDDIFRQAYHHKFKTKVGRSAAGEGARKNFIDYESVQGFVQVLRAPYRPKVARPGATGRPGPGGTAAMDSSVGATAFMMAGQPFLAFTARALPLVVEWMARDPVRARMYLALHDYLNRLAMTEAGLDPDAVYKSINSAPFWERMRYAPVGMLGRVMGMGPEERATQYETVVATPTVDVAYMTPFDMITGQIDPYARGSLRGLSEMTQKLSLGTNPMIGPVLNIMLNRDPFLRKTIYDDDLPPWQQRRQVASYLINAYLPPIVPSATDTFDFMKDAVDFSLDDKYFAAAEGDLNEFGRIKGGYTYEMLRSALKGIPNARGIVLSMSDALTRLGGAKLKEADPSKYAVYTADLALSHITNAMALAKKALGLGGIRSMKNLEGEVGNRLRDQALRYAHPHVETLVKQLTGLATVRDPATGKRDVPIEAREILAAAKQVIDLYDEDNPRLVYNHILRLLTTIRKYSGTARNAVEQDIIDMVSGFAAEKAREEERVKIGAEYEEAEDARREERLEQEFKKLQTPTLGE